MDPTADIEHKVLAIIRVKKNWYKYHYILQLQFFSNEATRQLFSIIEEFFKKYDSEKLTTGNMNLIIPRVIKDEELRDSCLEIVHKIGRLSHIDSKVIEATIRDFSRRQLAKIAITEGITLLESANPDFNILKEHVDKIINISTDGESDAYSYFNSPQNRIIAERDEKKIATGIPKLDETLRGGMSAGELLVFLGPPGRGKTLALINLGVGALLNGLFVFHATLEISDRKVARRYDSRIANTEFSTLIKNPRTILPYLERLKKKGAELIIRDYSMDSPKVSDLYGAIIRHEQRIERKCDIVIVDYGDLLTSTKTYRDPRFGLEDTYTELRRLGVKLGVPVITASQTTRKSLSKHVIDMEDVAESFGKVKVADVIIGICQTPEEEEEQLCRLFIAKSRKASGHPSMRLSMIPETMYLGEMHSAGRGSKMNLEKNY